MNYHLFQDTRGILWFSGISMGIVLCTIFVWVFILYESTVGRIDQTLRLEVQKIDMLFRVLATSDTLPSMTTKEISRQICTSPSELSIKICDTQGKHRIKKGFIDSTLSLSTFECSSLTQPISVTLKNNVAYRIYGRTFSGFSVCVATPMPTFWILIKENYSNPSVVFPLFTIMLAMVGIWSFIRLHQPIQRLDHYLQTLIRQPIGNELLQPPPSPKGDVYQLTQTVSKIVERLHISRNQALQFSSFATHELRTPLSIIRNQLESALASHSRTKELRSVVASAYDEMLRLSQTVEDLLSLATMQAGTLALNLETISLSKFLNHFYDEALFLSRPKNITVVLKKGPEVYLKVDVIRLRQVFFNLLDNAIKNTPSGNRVRLSYSLKDNTVIIVFADTGIGIAPEKLKKIFEPFFTDAQKRVNSQGAGLGLALVKWIIELHRGNITVLSEIGKGTEFIITLPYKRVLEKP
jgi:signal transduction histidine kinase